MLEMADGDGRALLNLIEQVAAWKLDHALDRDELAKRLMRRAARYDKSGDEHYNLISALHKSVRGSDPDAALYWFCRMLEGGEDPRFLARRITRMAVEDIGLADPQAQDVCLQSWQTYERLGSRKGNWRWRRRWSTWRWRPSRTPPTWPTRRRGPRRGNRQPDAAQAHPERPDAADEGRGLWRGYAYDHDAEDGFSGQDYFPEGMRRPVYYSPPERGFERELKKRVEYFARLRAKRQGG